MSFKKALPFKKAVAFAGAATLLLGVSSLSAYEQDWSDKQLGPEEGNSWFKVNGQIWAAYEFKDKKPDNTVDYSGFKVGRATVDIKGEGTKGAAEGFGYRILLDTNTTYGSAGMVGSNLTACLDTKTGGNDPTKCPVTNTNVNGYYNASKPTTAGPTPPTPFMKYAYFQIPVPGVKNTFIRAGFQPMPTVDGQAGASMEGIWGHRYLDADGKAIWEDVGASPSSDGGLGFIHKNDIFGIHVVLSNGPGFNNIFGANGGLANAVGRAAQINSNYVMGAAGAVDARSVGNGNAGDSWGLDLYGNLSLTPLKSKDDGGLDLTIQLPFRFKNVMGIDRSEYNGVYGMDFTNLDKPAFSSYWGSKGARQDRYYGFEIDAKYKMSATSSITLGGGTIRYTDKQSDAVVFSTSTIDVRPETFLATKNYYMGQDAYGSTNYAFIHGKFGMFGFVARVASGTGTGSLSTTMGAADNQYNNTVAQNVEKLISPVASDREDGAVAVALADRGLAKFQKKTFALTYMPNARFSAALGMSILTATQGNGDTVKADPLAAVESDASATSKTSLGAALRTANNISPNTAKFLTDANLYGVKNYDRQVFLRMQYMY